MLVWINGLFGGGKTAADFDGRAPTRRVPCGARCKLSPLTA
jgi:hypothetical protein